MTPWTHHSLPSAQTLLHIKEVTQSIERRLAVAVRQVLWPDQQSWMKDLKSRFLTELPETLLEFPICCPIRLEGKASTPV